MNADQLSDHIEIASLPVRYAKAIDSGDWDSMLACLDDTAAFVAGADRFEGASAIREMTEGALRGLDHSQHYITNVVVDLRGDEAEVQSYLQAQHVRDIGSESGNTYLVGGIFRDRVARTESGWRFVERNLEILWAEGDPAVHP